MRSSAFSINFSGISKWTTLITIIIFLSKIIEVLGQNICSILFSLMNGYFLIYFLSHFYVIRTGPVFGVLENCSSDKGILVRRNSGCVRDSYPIAQNARFYDPFFSKMNSRMMVGVVSNTFYNTCRMYWYTYILMKMKRSYRKRDRKKHCLQRKENFYEFLRDKCLGLIHSTKIK